MQQELEKINEVFKALVGVDACVRFTKGGTHEEGSVHPYGGAADFRVWVDPFVKPVEEAIRTGGKGYLTPDQVSDLVGRLKDVLGPEYDVLDERWQPPGSDHWGGPHIHIESKCPIR